MSECSDGAEKCEFFRRQDPNGPNFMERMSGPVCEATTSDLSPPGLQEEGGKNSIRVPSLHP